MNYKRLNKIITIVILSSMLILSYEITGTLAYQDLSQHKTNSIKSSPIDYNIVLIEDFKEQLNWTLSDQPIETKVRVRNGQESDIKGDTTYEDVFIRIQFKEFMQVTEQIKTFSSSRYLVDSGNEFIKFADEKEAKQYAKDHKHQLPDDTKIEKVKAYRDSTHYFYLASNLKDQAEKYGKHLLINVTTSTPNSLIPGVNKGDPGNDLSHKDTIVIEDYYSTHRWDTTKENQGYAEDSLFTEYVKWNLGSDVITYTDWKNQGFNDVEKWIIDDTSHEGWVYWGQVLKHSTDEVAASQSITSNFIESVELSKQPEGVSEYYMHVNLDAISKFSFDQWSDAPEDILDYLKFK